MLEELQLLSESVIPSDAPIVGDLPAAAPALKVSPGLTSDMPASVVYRLADDALYEELRSAIRAADRDGPSLVQYVERPLRAVPPQWVEEQGKRRCQTEFEAIYLLGLRENPRAWSAAMRLGRALEWNGNGRLDYTISPGLLWDRAGDGDGHNLHACLLASDLGVLVLDEMYRIARRAYGKVQKFQPTIISDEPADWYNTRAIRLFCGEFLLGYHDREPNERDAVVVELPWVHVAGSW